MKITFENLDCLIKVHTMTQYFICERNKIIENPFKYFNPFYKSKLKLIDYQIDNLLAIRDFLEKNIEHENIQKRN